MEDIAKIESLNLDEVKKIIDGLINSKKTPLPGFMKLRDSTETEHELYFVNAIKASLKIDVKN